MNSACLASWILLRSLRLMFISRLMKSIGRCLKILMTTFSLVSTWQPMNTRAEDPLPSEASTSQSSAIPQFLLSLATVEKGATLFRVKAGNRYLANRCIINIIMQQTDKEVSKSRIVTIVRVRPPLRGQDEPQVIALKGQNTLQIEISGLKRLEKVQLALGPSTTQRQVFTIIEPLLHKVAEGFNISVLTYGQTGSGKTHTMFGNDWNNIVRRDATGYSSTGEERKQEQITFLRSIEQDENYAGVIPRSIHLLFDQLVVKRRKFIKVYCSFLQIYNEHMTDLLQDDPKAAREQKLLIHENKKDGIYVQGLNEIVVEDPEQCLELMQRGQRNRVVRQTTMNAKSSRSHTIFTLLIEEVFPSKKSYRRMKINLCDLAGSQKIHKGQTMSTAHFQELKNINLSLTTLGKVIGSLAAAGKAIPPYRQSKLTRLLQDTLGGNTSTVLVAAVAGKMSCLEESLNTLKFLERARQIKGQVVAKVYSENPDMRNLEREISYLRDMLKMRGGQLPSDVEIRNKYKALQEENNKLKQMVDIDLLARLKKENTHLKQQLTYQSNDILSESQLRIRANRTIDQHETINSDKSQEVLPQISSTTNTAKYRSKKEDTKSLAARTEDSISQNRSTFQKRGTGISMFPAVGRNGGRGSNKILQRILEIERAKQENKLKLERQLQQLERKQGEDRKMSRTRKS